MRMALSLRTIEARVGSVAHRTEWPSWATGQALKNDPGLRELGLGWPSAKRGERVSYPTARNMACLGLANGMGHPSEASENLRVYGLTQIETVQTFEGPEQVGGSVAYHGKLSEPIAIEGVPVARTLIETMEQLILAFAGPARERLGATPATIRVIKDRAFAHAIMEIAGPGRRHEVYFWPSDIDALMKPGVPERERTVETSVTFWPGVFRQLADIWLETQQRPAQNGGADTLPGVSAPPKPREQGTSTPPQRKADCDKRHPSVCARAHSSPVRTLAEKGAAYANRECTTGP